MSRKWRRFSSADHSPSALRVSDSALAPATISRSRTGFAASSSISSAREISRSGTYSASGIAIVRLHSRRRAEHVHGGRRPPRAYLTDQQIRAAAAATLGVHQLALEQRARDDDALHLRRALDD